MLEFGNEKHIKFLELLNIVLTYQEAKEHDCGCEYCEKKGYYICPHCDGCCIERHDKNNVLFCEDCDAFLWTMRDYSNLRKMSEEIGIFDKVKKLIK